MVVFHLFIFRIKARILFSDLTLNSRSYLGAMQWMALWEIFQCNITCRDVTYTKTSALPLWLPVITFFPQCFIRNFGQKGQICVYI